MRTVLITVGVWGPVVLFTGWRWYRLGHKHGVAQGRQDVLNAISMRTEAMEKMTGVHDVQRGPQP